MSNELAIVGQEPASLATTGGLGLDFGSKLFALKPATININQPMTRAEGAIKGKFRISETGDQFDELFCTLLVMPKEQRSYYLKTGDNLSRSPENLMCFSRDMVAPHEDAKVPQAIKCANCAKASWEKWRQTKLKDDIPPCDAYYYALFIDTVYQMPLQMYIRGGAKAPFEQGMQNLSRRFAMMKAQGKNPNIFDIGFKMRTKKVEKGGNLSWVPELFDFAEITPEQKASFGSIYQTFVSRGTQAADDSESSEIDNALANIDEQVTGGKAPLDGEYVTSGTGEITI